MTSHSLGRVPTADCRDFSLRSLREEEHEIGESINNTHRINPECDPSRPVAPSRVIRQDHRHEQLRDIVAHGDET